MLHTQRQISRWNLSPLLACCTRRCVAIRIALLVVLAWLTAVIFNSTVLVAPVLVGRALLFSIPHLPVAGALRSNGNDCSEMDTRLTLQPRKYSIGCLG
jgi:hypothetical protein